MPYRSLMARQTPTQRERQRAWHTCRVENLQISRRVILVATSTKPAFWIAYRPCGCDSQKPRRRPVVGLQSHTILAAPSGSCARSSFRARSLLLFVTTRESSIKVNALRSCILPDRGQPADAPGAWHGSLSFKHQGDLTDRHASDAGCSRLALTASGFNHTVLSRCRNYASG